MLIRPFVPHALAAALAFGLAPAGAAPAPARTVPLHVDWSLTPARIEASCKAEIESAGKRIDAMLRVRSARTFRTVAEPLENALADLGDNLAAPVLLFEVSPDKAVRDASEQCNNAVAAFNAELFSRPDLYAALAAASKSGTARGAAQKKLLELHLVSAKRAGAGLPPARRQRFVAIAKQIADLETRFSSTLSADPSAITITREQADGLKPDLLAGLKTDADGKLVVPVNESTSEQFMRFRKGKRPIRKPNGMPTSAASPKPRATRPREARMFHPIPWSLGLLR